MEISSGKDTKSNLVTQQLGQADDIESERNRSHRLVTTANQPLIPSVSFQSLVMYYFSIKKSGVSN